MGIEKGSRAWWIWVAIIKCAEEYRETVGDPSATPIISDNAVLQFLDRVEEDPVLKRQYLETMGEAEHGALHAVLGADVTLVDDKGEATFMSEVQ